MWGPQTAVFPAVLRDISSEDTVRPVTDLSSPMKTINWKFSCGPGWKQQGPAVLHRSSAGSLGMGDTSSFLCTSAHLCADAKHLIRCHSQGQQSSEGKGHLRAEF